MAESDAFSNHLSPLDAREKRLILLPRLNLGGSIVTSSGPPFKSQLILSDQSTVSDSTWTSRPQPVLHSTAGLPKGYTPIPTLLAKSVGNKVTLMKRPADYSEVKDRRIRGSLPTSAAIRAKAQNSSGVHQNAGGLHQTEEHGQSAALSKPVQATPRQTITKNPLPVNCTAPEGLGRLQETEGSGPVAVSVQPFVDQTRGESFTQQVVILPSKLLAQKDSELASPFCQQQSAAVQVPVSGPLCMSTNVPGFTIPENKIPVQQVAPLKNTMISRAPVSLRSQEEVTNTAASKGTQIWNPPFSLTKSSMFNSSSSTNSSSSSTSESSKPPEDQQELRTVCIRDSQSILVTTRGGNTGIVKVQSSSDQNAHGSFSTNPVITISPQLKAFLVSKATQNLSPSAPAPTSCTIPAVTSISGAQAQRPVSTTMKGHDAFALLPAGAGCIPAPDPRIAAANPAAAFAKGPGSTISSAERIHPCIPAAGSSSIFQPSVGKPTVASTPCRSSPQAELGNKTGVKRAGTDEISQHTKFILVSPSSLSTVSTVALSNSPPSSTLSLPTSGVMFFSQPAASFTSTSAGIAPAQPQPHSTSLSNLKIGFRPGQPAGNLKPEASKLKNITLPSGGCSEPQPLNASCLSSYSTFFSLSLQGFSSSCQEGRR